MTYSGDLALRRRFWDIVQAVNAWNLTHTLAVLYRCPGKQKFLSLSILPCSGQWMNAKKDISTHVWAWGEMKVQHYQLFGAWTENREGDLWFHFSLEKLAAKKRDLWKGKIFTPVKMVLKVKLPAGVPGWKLQLREVKMAKGAATFVISRGEDFLWTEFVVLVPESQEETIFKLRWAWA